MASPRTDKVVAHLFDIRNIVGALLGIYGVLLTIAGFVPSVLRSHDNVAAAGDRAGRAGPDGCARRVLHMGDPAAAPGRRAHLVGHLHPPLTRNTAVA